MFSSSSHTEQHHGGEGSECTCALVKYYKKKKKRHIVVKLTAFSRPTTTNKIIFASIYRNANLANGVGGAAASASVIA